MTPNLANRGDLDGRYQLAMETVTVPGAALEHRERPRLGKAKPESAPVSPTIVRSRSFKISAQLLIDYVRGQQ